MKRAVLVFAYLASLLFVTQVAAQIPLRFTYESTVANPSSSAFNPTGEFIFPSIIRAADHIANPLGTYYMYYAPHDAPGGMALRYSNSISGPWTEYANNPILNRNHQNKFSVTHVSSPHVMWMPQYNKYFMYFHGENTTTRWAHSADGINWDVANDNVAINTTDWGATFGTTFSESSYARVYEYTIPRFGDRYTMISMLIRSGNGRRIGLATSNDGKNFTPRDWSLVAPQGSEGTQLSGPSYIEYNGRHYVLYHSDSGNIYQTEVGSNFDLENHLGIFHDPSPAAPELNKAADPFLLYAENQWHLFYTVGLRLHQSIGYARLGTGSVDGWTGWLNRDGPGGSGDYETRKDFSPPICSNASQLEARQAGTNNVFTPGQATPENLSLFSLADGLACRNADQSDGVCNDYEVRFYCGAGGNVNITIQAENYTYMNGVQTETTTDTGGGLNVGWIDVGDWMAYSNVTNIPSAGNYLIRYRVASPAGATFSADLNSGATQLGTVNIPATGGWQNWTTVQHTVYLPAGPLNFGIYASTSSWNINWFSIQSL